MNAVMDRIFLMFFTTFIASVATASVVVANIHTTPTASVVGSVAIHSSLEEKALLPNKGVAIVEDDGDTLSDRGKSVSVIPEEPEPIINNNVIIDINHVAAAQALVVLTPEQFKALISAAINEGLKPLPAKAKPLWRQMVSLAMSGIKLPHQIMMMIPGGTMIESLAVLYVIVTYKPELITWAIERMLELSPSLVLLLAKLSTEIVAGTAAAGIDAVLPKLSPATVAWVNYLVPSAFNTYAKSWGF